MGSREDILADIRRRQARGGAAPSRAELEEQRTYLRAHPRGPLPEVSDDLGARLLARAAAAASTGERVASLADAPAAVARFLDAHRLTRSGCVWPRLAHLDWKDAGLELEARAARGEDRLGVTGAYCALAETGTLMMVSGADTPAATSLLPETHVAIVPLERVVPCMEDGWDLLRAEQGQLPRAVNFISGPSRTADIEQTLVLGAHGPFRVHIILVG
ncbi:MAG TPA: lactate utilization protein C [Burkholderiales bacterium]|nr:lactate utilization protein C [Burkholderiales bacterium]